MSLKTFCDICLEEIVGHDNEITVWSHPTKSYCIKCWIDEKNWQAIHEIVKRNNKLGTKEQIHTS